MRRPREAGLLIIAVVSGLCGSLLVAFAAGSTFDWSAPGSLPRQAWLWVQLGLAALACHVLLVVRGSRADETLLPTSIALSGLGLTTISSLDPRQGQAQVTWLWVSLGLMVLVLLRLRRVGDLREYPYSWGLITVLLLLAPMLVGIEANGARLWVNVGFARVQPSEPAKLTLVLFLAAYLASARGALLADDSWHLGPLRLPRPRYLLPVVVMWAGAMALLVALRDLGTALLFFGTFICLLYAATGQVVYLAGGLASFAAGAYAAARTFGHVAERVAAWLNPWPTQMLERGGYQIVQGLFAIAAGGVSGVGLGFSQLISPFSGKLLFAATTDLPFAAICEQLGMWGAGLVISLYAFWVYRALRVAVRQRDEFVGLLCVGLATLMGLQTLVIMGGVTKLVPLTGITLPFISYGGSSLVVNYLMLALLLSCDGEQA